MPLSVEHQRASGTVLRTLCQQVQMNPGVTAEAVMGGQVQSIMQQVSLTEPLLIAQMLAAEALLLWVCMFLFSFVKSHLRLVMGRYYPAHLLFRHRGGMAKGTLEVPQQTSSSAGVCLQGSAQHWLIGSGKGLRMPP